VPVGKPSAATRGNDGASAGTPATAAQDLPSDPELLRSRVLELERQIAEQAKLIRHLHTALENLERRHPSNGSEKIRQSIGQLLLEFGEVLDGPGPSPEADPTPTPDPDDKPEPRKGRKGKGRRKLSANLPRQRIVYDEPKTCPCCSKPLRKIGEEISEQLEREPAKLYVIEHVRNKYAPCDDCAAGTPVGAAPGPTTSEPCVPVVAEPSAEQATAASTISGLVQPDGVIDAQATPATVCRTADLPSAPVTAPVPAKPIPKGIPGPKLVAWILTRKYRYHLPLYRVQQMLAQEGADLVYQTIVGWVAWCAFLLRPVRERMKENLLQSEVIHTDDTRVRNIKTQRVPTGFGRLWPYVGDSAHPEVVFDYTTGRTRDGPAGFLAGWLGKLQADAWNGYDRLYAGGGVVEVACWAHARRKFHEILGIDPRRAGIAIGFIRCLFRIEARAKQLGLAAADVVALRQRKSTVVLDCLLAHLEQIKQDLTPEHQLVKAANYVTNQWQALREFLTDAALDIDNNEAERTIRAIAVGRKNWMFVVGDESGDNAAVLYSVIATCLRNGIDPDEYLAAVLPVLATQPASRAKNLTPLAWHTARQASAAAASAPTPAAPVPGALQPA
jgi:transposase